MEEEWELFCEAWYGSVHINGNKMKIIRDDGVPIISMYPTTQKATLAACQFVVMMSFLTERLDEVSEHDYNQKTDKHSQ